MYPKFGKGKHSAHLICFARAFPTSSRAPDSLENRVVFRNDVQWLGAQMFCSALKLGVLTCRNWQGVMVLYSGGENGPKD